MRLIPALLFLAAACGHTEPYTTAPINSDGPFAGAAPARLTYNSFTDSAASLTADGQGLMYLYTGFANGDRCIGLMPAGGGSRRWELCDTLGWRIARWVQAHADDLNVSYVIWDRQKWNPGASDRWRPYTHPYGNSNPTLAHRDHVHVSVKR